MTIIIDNISIYGTESVEAIEFLIDRILYHNQHFDFYRDPYRREVRPSRLRVKPLYDTVKPDLYVGLRLNLYKELPLEHSIIYNDYSIQPMVDRIIEGLNYNIPEQKHYSVHNNNNLFEYCRRNKYKSMIFLPFFESDRTRLDLLYNTNYADRLSDALLDGFQSMLSSAS